MGRQQGHNTVQRKDTNPKERGKKTCIGLESILEISLICYLTLENPFHSRFGSVRLCTAFVWIKVRELYSQGESESFRNPTNLTCSWTGSTSKHRDKTLSEQNKKVIFFLFKGNEKRKKL